jgi:hypothetical protein
MNKNFTRRSFVTTNLSGMGALALSNPLFQYTRTERHLQELRRESSCLQRPVSSMTLSLIIWGAAMAHLLRGTMTITTKTGVLWTVSIRYINPVLRNKEQ